MVTIAFLADETELIPAQIGWRGARQSVTGRTPILVVSDEQAGFVDHWKKIVAMGFHDEGRAEVVAEMRKAGESPAVRRGGKRFSGRCSYCLTKADDLERDHITPFVRGGGEEPDNLTPACRSCNSMKKDRSLLQFVAAGGIA